MMSVLSIPSIILYASGTSVKEIMDGETIAKLSLGNIGQSNMACGSSRMENDVAEFSFNCPFGTLGAMTNFGQLSARQTINC